MTDSEATTTTTTTNDVIRIATSFKPKTECDSGGSNVSFDESNLLLLKKYHDFEEHLKLEYYKSNPLRNYVSSIYGQSIMPHHNNNNKLGFNNVKNKKKSLPKIFDDLRITQNFQQDRTIHRQQLCTSLNINLNSLDILNKKNPIDLLEESKKIYSEYCKYNLSKPIDLTNVESILKVNILNNNNNNVQTMNEEKSSSTTTTTTELSNHDTFSNSLTNSQASLEAASDYSFSVQPSSQQQQQQQVKRIKFKLGTNNSDILLNINAQQAKIKELTQINNDIKEHKKQLASNNIDSINLRHHYKTIESDDDTQDSKPKQQAQKQQQQQQYKGSIYNYTRNNNRKKYRNNNNNEILETQITSKPIVQKSQVTLNNNSNIFYESTTIHKQQYYNENINNNANIIRRNEKEKKRVKCARDKILNETNEKMNLNKMTILQPFEDTKILINIDKVSSKILNSLLNKHDVVPRYYMPPINSVGYFKRVLTNDPTVLINNNNVNLTNSAAAAAANSTVSYDHNLHHHINNQTSRYNTKLESLKSLSEQNSRVPTFYFEDDLDDITKYREKSDMSMKSLEYNSRRNSGKGIPI